ncbi:MAG: hypothetical protein ABIJ09_17605 [Pseudomonadota bacterium]
MDDADVALDGELIFQGLTYRWSFHGLQLGHFSLAGGLTMVVFFLGIFLDFNILYGFAFFAAACMALVVIQWRKPPDYLGELYDLATLPRHLTALDDDPWTVPFPVAPEDLATSRMGPHSRRTS